MEKQTGIKLFKGTVKNRKVEAVVNFSDKKIDRLIIPNSNLSMQERNVIEDIVANHFFK